MGMTLWIHTLQGRSMTTESDDHSLMYAHADTLDTLCRQLGVAALSSFFDMTDLAYAFPDDDDEQEGGNTEGSPLDPETGLEYGIDDMKWFDSSEGIASLTALRSHIEAKGVGRLSDDDKRHLVEEIDDCLEKLEAARSGKFHLAVVA
jgi:hypothetical protein